MRSAKSLAEAHALAPLGVTASRRALLQGIDGSRERALIRVDALAIGCERTGVLHRLVLRNGVQVSLQQRTALIVRILHRLDNAR